MSAVATTVDPLATPPQFPPGGNQSPKVIRTPVNTPWTGREWRVAILLVMVALVSLADLIMTLTYLKNGGMSEGNPIARWVMSLGCPWLLSVWKAGLVGFSCCILFAFRKRLSAEIGTWICCLAMTWLTFQWSGYVRDINALMDENPQIVQASSWVAFEGN